MVERTSTPDSEVTSHTRAVIMRISENRAWRRDPLFLLLFGGIRHLPPLIARVLLPYRIATGCLMTGVLFLAVCSFLFLFRKPEWAFPEIFRSQYGMGLLLLVMMLGSLAAWMIVLLARYRVRQLGKKAAELSFEVCMRCGYHLHGLPSEGICPECAAGFDKSSLQTAWMGLLGNRGEKVSEKV